MAELGEAAMKLWSFWFVFGHSGLLISRANVPASAAPDLGACVIDVFARLKLEAAIFALWANYEADTLNNFNPRHSTSPING
ncbi:hypothetical protein X769_15085 [Mesorhizobium sp. LSJC268A00]|nr:hypothetical protein X769_15085 [Mesorhizobium sp. LSJC268A00]ESY04459.1 hypothetical protein X753_18675 [Mesorhizobium sp. LNJC399B00]ESY48057.1 hypothetical protein X746_10260 [Mesorhizobium sp. LNJC380A00]ESY52089.1 hypothetical protein X745_21790 [Mesorhizobium sp. LNJC374B00]ESY61246.1 hypothetical protein X744_03870 [Mesorhizobium sp. LNJC372A00]ESZ03692.1 hypothetical protein X736_25310 [Mesorhizobium sp. L2C089B000]ESZ39092.1 hypothetical protein X732_16765 [Mesorhizobium sp. L2C06